MKSLHLSYTFFSPVYDFFVAPFTKKLRQQSLSTLETLQGSTIFLPGIGSGLDIPFLPKNREYIASDLTKAMLKKTIKRVKKYDINMECYCGDSMQTPHPEHSFDIVILHLILAVVPHPEKVLAEANRVLKPGGYILILDKFLQPQEKAYFKRMLNHFTRHIATRTDVVLEHLLENHPELKVVMNQGVLANGWFRQIQLHKVN